LEACCIVLELECRQAQDWLGLDIAASVALEEVEVLVDMSVLVAEACMQACLEGVACMQACLVVEACRLVWWVLAYKIALEAVACMRASEAVACKMALVEVDCSFVVWVEDHKLV